MVVRRADGTEDENRFGVNLVPNEEFCNEVSVVGADGRGDREEEGGERVGKGRLMGKVRETIRILEGGTRWGVEEGKEGREVTFPLHRGVTPSLYRAIIMNLYDMPTTLVSLLQ